MNRTNRMLSHCANVIASGSFGIFALPAFSQLTILHTTRASFDYLSDLGN